MLIKALLQANRQNPMFPSLPTSDGNLASYRVFVRQNGAVVEGIYTLDGVQPSSYSSVTCIYYNYNNVEISRSVTQTQPAFCQVSDAVTPGVNKLEMQVTGIYSAPTSGSIKLDGTYVPRGSMSNYGHLFGRGNSETCTTMRLNAFNMPNGQIQIDSNSGALTWTVVPKRFDSNSIVRLQKVLVETMSSNIGTIAITPYIRQNNDQTVQINPISGQANSPITGFANDYNVDIVYFIVMMYPIYLGYSIDPNQVAVNVDYCFVIGNPNTSPMLNGIQPYFMPNDMFNNYVQQPRMSTYAFHRFSFTLCLFT